MGEIVPGETAAIAPRAPGVLPTHGTCGHSMAGPDSFANPGFGQPVATLGTESCCPMVPNSQRRAEQIESRILPLSVGGPSEPPGGLRGPMVRDFRPSPPSGPALGAVLGAPWPVSGACRVVLGPSLDVLGPSWGPAGPSWAICGPSRAGVERREAQNGKSQNSVQERKDKLGFLRVGAFEGVILEPCGGVLQTPWVI